MRPLTGVPHPSRGAHHRRPPANASKVAHPASPAVPSLAPGAGHWQGRPQLAAVEALAAMLVAPRAVEEAACPHRCRRWRHHRSDPPRRCLPEGSAPHLRCSRHRRQVLLERVQLVEASPALRPSNGSLSASCPRR